jgi:hypothetical protein
VLEKNPLYEQPTICTQARQDLNFIEEYCNILIPMYFLLTGKTRKKEKAHYRKSRGQDSSPTSWNRPGSFRLQEKLWRGESNNIYPALFHA